MKDRLRDPKADVGRVINDVRTEGGGFAVVHYNGHWYPQSAGLGQDQLPKSLRDAVLLGNSGRQRYDRSGDPYLAIGLYVAANDAAYFEVFPNANLQRTMSVIGTSLAVGATVTALASPPASAGGPAAASSTRCRAWPTPPASWPRAASTPASPRSPTPTCTASSARSTTWPTPCRTASSARPASRRTSATSCARPSPR